MRNGGYLLLLFNSNSVKECWNEYNFWCSEREMEFSLNFLLDGSVIHMESLNKRKIKIICKNCTGGFCILEVFGLVKIDWISDMLLSDGIVMVRWLFLIIHFIPFLFYFWLW